jgi:transcriptional regulator with GAF, ATPase, and Fis domain
VAKNSVANSYCEDAVNDEKRNNRLRLLVSRLNKERKKQAQQIDILCNDLLAAQKQFLRELKVISFCADFHESILGLTDLNELLVCAATPLKEHITDATVAFFLLSPGSGDQSQNGNFEMHIFESDRPIDLENKRIENFFTADLIDSIAQSSRLCTIDDMLALGLVANPRSLEKVSAVGLPLNHHGCALGCVLLYRSSTNPFTREELKSLEQISSGLSRALASRSVAKVSA